MKKRICFLVDSIFSIGGVQRVTAVIASALSKEYDVTIVTFDNPESMNTSLYELKEALKVLFACEVDLVRYRDSLRPLFKSNIIRDVIYV